MSETNETSTHNQSYANFSKKYDIGGHSAHTLSPEHVGDNDSGWTIKGEIHEDWYEWVNEFEANHDTYGRVWGDFEKTVYADSEEGFNHFIKHHEPNSWDYWDI